MVRSDLIFFAQKFFMIDDRYDRSAREVATRPGAKMITVVKGKGRGCSSLW